VVLVLDVLVVLVVEVVVLVLDVLVVLVVEVVMLVLVVPVVVVLVVRSRSRRHRLTKSIPGLGPEPENDIPIRRGCPA
jgi:hypothetical protein